MLIQRHEDATSGTDLVEPRVAAGIRRTQGLVFYADSGYQYTSDQLARPAEQAGVRLSVGRTGVCWDNAQQEGFWSTLKPSTTTGMSSPPTAEAIAAVTGWIDNVYNRRRRHSALGQIPSVTFEN